MSQPSSDNPTAAILVIGNEILTGRTHDKNTQHIAAKLLEHGIQVVEARVVQDIEAEIIDAVNALREKADYLFTTGGIGPTHDDITSESVTKALGKDFGLHEEAYQALLNHYGSKDELNEARLRMAKMPLDATLIDNPVSGAPGFVSENVYVMAGVPKIMQGMLDNILPTLGKGAEIYSNTLKSKLYESVVAEGLGALQSEYDMIEIGCYPRFEQGKASISVVLRGTDRQSLTAATKDLVALIKELGDDAEAVSLQVPMEG